ncbi:MAG: DUF3159 domain-containing protein [Anaerolineae bacterium]|nr:DUF3159 domain-containing protein [Anaerolineae bacterium]
MSAQSKARELLDELRAVFTGRGGWLDSALPPLVFVALNAWLGLEIAAWSALGVAAVSLVWRVFKRQHPWHALGGLGGVGLAVLLAQLLGRTEGFFVPGLVSGGMTVLACLLSLLIKRPLAAWTSHLARRWPRAWYWHPRVRPAYSEVTLGWLIVFALRLALQIVLFRREAPGLLAVANLIGGWPFTLVLLVASYLYGLWRLQILDGPSVEEFTAGAEPPWEGQKRGF